MVAIYKAIIHIRIRLLCAIISPPSRPIGRVAWALNTICTCLAY